MKRAFAIGLAFFLTTIPVALASRVVDDCSREMEDGITAMSAFGTVPQALAATVVQRITYACQEALPDSIEPTSVILPEIIDADVCSGGSTTLLGWRNYIRVGLQNFQVANGPASSYYSSVDTALVGHTSSTLDDLNVARQNAVWQFARLPMGGHASEQWNCNGFGLMTSISITLSGTPLGVSTGTLAVVSSGTTCLVPC